MRSYASTARRGLAFCGLVLGLLAVATARAQVRDTRLVWRTVRSAHFEVHYHEPLGILARRILVLAERAQERLAPYLNHRPRGRTQVILSDFSDAANGSATVTPYNAVRLFASAPDDLSELSDYDDWLKVLVTHEHAHIVHIDNIGGLPALINRVLGKVYAPNNVQPSWFIEGLATYEESRHSSGGRLRSTMFDMFLRANALEDRLVRLDQLSHTIDRWPFSNIWYLYGSRFARYLAVRYGDDVFGEIATDYGSEAIPYGLNRTARRATGKSLVELYEEFLQDARRNALRAAQRVKHQGRIEGRRLTFHGLSTRAPRFVDSHTLVYLARDGRSPDQLRLVDLRPDSPPTQLVRVVGSSYAAFDPVAEAFYYNSLDTKDDLYFFYDLFRYDTRTKTTERLTEGLRAREPDVSPDGSRIAFVVGGAGTRHLALAKVNSIADTLHFPVRSRRFEQVYTPRFSPDGRSIAYSAWHHEARRNIWVLDLETGERRRVTNDRAFNTGPCWSPDGNYLYFSSDRSGIANIYAYEFASKRLRQVTNVVNGAYHPAISPDGKRLVYLGYTSDGFDLFAMNLRPARFKPAEPYIDERPPPRPRSKSLEAFAPSAAYRPGPTLIPRSYLLELSEDGFGRQIGLLIEGSDAVGYHAYSGRVGVGLERGNVSARLAWDYRRTRVPIHLRGFRRESPRTDLVVAGRRRGWIEETVGAEVAINYPLPHALFRENLRLGYSLTFRDKAEPFGGNLDPNDPPPQLPDTGRIATARLGWSLSNTVRNALDISTSQGQTVDVSIAFTDPSIGSSFTSVGLTWSFRQFLRAPWHELHVFAARYAGGIGAGDLGRRPVFAVGGFPSIDLLDALQDGTILGGAALRGYPAFFRAGNNFHLLQMEYRLPLVRPQVGAATYPIYVNRMYALVFADAGDAYNDNFELSRLRVGVGGEILTDFTLGYFLPFTLRVGLGRGLNEGGETQLYANLGVPF